MANKTCHLGDALLPQNNFTVHACRMCLRFVFGMVNNEGLFVGLEEPSYNDFVYDNITFIKILCKKIKSVYCKHWLNCCKDALRCCDSQFEIPADKSYCPSIWDGLSCLSATPPGQVFTWDCPTFIDPIRGGKAKSICLTEGVWSRGSKPIQSASYDDCLGISIGRQGLLVGWIVSAISILCLVASLALFTCTKTLLIKQHVKVHIHFFLALLLSAVCWSLYDYFVVLAELDHELGHPENLELCATLTALGHYLRLTTYCWMMLEVVYLHWHLRKAFVPLKSLKPFLYCGWGGPFLIVSLYIVARVFAGHGFISLFQSCWFTQESSHIWILYAPVIAVLLFNTIALTTIVHMLSRCVLTCSKDLKDYKQGLLSAFLLIPLFSLQHLFLLYHPAKTTPGYHAYELFAAFIVNSQGMFASFIFCLGSRDVRSVLHHACSSSQQGRRGSHNSVLRKISSVSFKEPRGDIARQSSMVSSGKSSTLQGDESLAVLADLFPSLGHAQQESSRHKFSIDSRTESAYFNFQERQGLYPGCYAVRQNSQTSASSARRITFAISESGSSELGSQTDFHDAMNLIVHRSISEVTLQSTEEQDALTAPMETDAHLNKLSLSMMESTYV